MRRACTMCLLVLALACWLACAAPAALAASGSAITMPTKPNATVAGLRLNVATQWVETPGYRPITIEVTCFPASSADRSLRVQVVGGSYMAGRTAIRAGADIEIPSGATTVTKTISMPQLIGMQFLSLDVWEGGVHLDDLSFENRYVATAGVGGGENLCSVLFVSDQVIDTSKLAFLFPSNAAATAQGAAAGNFPLTSNLTTLPSAELDDQWINYSSLDVVCISRTDIESLIAKRPAVWRALRQWVWLGGNLCVYGVGQDWKGLEWLEERLECPPREVTEESPYRGWDPAPQDLYGVPWQLNPNTQTYGLNPRGSRSPGFPPSKPPFVRRFVKFGQVIAIATDKPFAMSTLNWQWVFNRIGIDRAKWESRHGLSYWSENPGFDDFLIAQVGLPPVKTYRVLITLFVVAIGPVNYWLLYRKGRLPLLLFTVPAAALLISGALFAYVLVADGLSTYVRARSITELDQRRHQAVSWSRLSYYAGVAPARGLVFPTDTAVLPLMRAAGQDAGREMNRQLVWNDQQNLTRGWLSSRTPTQYVTLRAYNNDAELAIAPASDQAYCDVANRLGMHVHGVWVCDEQGQIYVGKDIADRARQRLQTLEAAEADGTSPNLLKQLRANTPEFPSDLPPSSSFNLFGRRRVRFAYQSQNASASPATSLLETSLASTLDAIVNRALEPRTYVALVSRPAGVVIGVEGTVETQSSHVILGRW
jgi:hypothetical protein